MFHVEHSPVDQPAPSFRWSLYQAGSVRVDDLYRECCSQVGKGTPALTQHVYVESAGRDCEAERARSRAVPRLSRHSCFLMTRLDQASLVRHPEGTSSPEEIQRLEI